MDGSSTVTGSNFLFMHPPVPQVGSLRHRDGYGGKIVASKSEFEFFPPLSQLYQIAYFDKCWWTLLKLKWCNDLRGKEIYQKNYQKRVIQGQIQDMLMLTSPAIYTT